MNIHCTTHSRATKILIRNQSLFMGPSQGQRAMLGGPEFVFWEILANGGGQKKSKNWNDISCSEISNRLWHFIHDFNAIRSYIVCVESLEVWKTSSLEKKLSKFSVLFL